MSDGNQIAGPFAVRFLPRIRHRPRVVHENRKQAPEIAVIRPHDLSTVHDFLAALISREQVLQKRPLIAWESVQKRYHAMVTELNGPDKDLHDQYHVDLGFFKEVMDEQVLEVWTGKKSVIDVLSLPEFSDMNCVREPNPPYDLMIMMSDRENHRRCNSVGTETEECEEPTPNLKSPVKSKKSSNSVLKDTPATLLSSRCSKKQLLEKSDAEKKKPIIRGKEKAGNLLEGDSRTTAMTDCLKSVSSSEVLNGKNHDHLDKLPIIAPEPIDLPNPLDFFSQDTTACESSDSCLQASPFQKLPCDTTGCEIQSDRTNTLEGNKTSDLDINDLSPLCEQMSSLSLSRLEGNDSNVEQKGASVAHDVDGHVSPTEKTGILQTSASKIGVERAPFGKGLFQKLAAFKHKDEQFATPSPIEKSPFTERASSAVSRSFGHKENTFCDEMSPSSSSTDPCADVSSSINISKSAAEDSQASVASSQEKQVDEQGSVLDGLVFPECSEDLKRYLDFIRKIVATYNLVYNIQPKMDQILGELKEEVSPDWVDYVLKYIPEVSLLPFDGEIFMAWKGVSQTQS
ncbi:unnamed protein product [Cylicocyclus nassatus]|uniref:Uncharacterized protein n=1 Tax=Cylicocyclus nassatus TaxID=53992 RepID=A0AA36DQW5_CYLNA|nr:unnamed protein product [Cylicocyclus nassatus]